MSSIVLDAWKRYVRNGPAPGCLTVAVRSRTVWARQRCASSLPSSHEPDGTPKPPSGTHGLRASPHFGEVHSVKSDSVDFWRGMQRLSIEDVGMSIGHERALAPLEEP